MPIWEYDIRVARAATTTDAFNAIAEQRRRDLLDLLRQGECAVGELVTALGLSQPLVSKHLRVLREVGLVQVTEVGRQRRYRLDSRPLQEIHSWVGRYEQLWNERFDVMDEVLADLDEDPENLPDPNNRRKSS